MILKDIRSCYHHVAGCYISICLIKYTLLYFDSKLIALAGMDNKQVQVNIRIAENSAVRLKELAESSGLKLGAFVERLIAGYRPDSNALQNDSSEVQDLRAVVEELRGMIADQEVRLNALEVALMTGLGDSKGKIKVKIESAENEAVEADNDDSLHPADPLPTAQEFNQDKDQFRAAVVELYQQGVTGSPDILKILNEQGYRNSKGNSYYRNDVRNALKDAGIVEQR